MKKRMFHQSLGRKKNLLYILYDGGWRSLKIICFFFFFCVCKMVEEPSHLPTLYLIRSTELRGREAKVILLILNGALLWFSFPFAETQVKSVHTSSGELFWWTQGYLKTECQDKPFCIKASGVNIIFSVEEDKYLNRTLTAADTVV